MDHHSAGQHPENTVAAEDILARTHLSTQSTETSDLVSIIMIH